MDVDYDPLSPRWRDDPYPVYRQLRDHDPVHRAPESGIWCLSRHEDVLAALKQPQRFSSSAMNDVLNDLGRLGPRFVLALLRFLLRTRVNPFALRRRGSLISLDPPRHDALRAIVQRGFSPRGIATWEPRARQLVAAGLRGLAPGRTFDVIRELAVPLPVTVIAEMLGVETHRLEDFKRWSDTIIAVTTGAARGDPARGGLLDDFTELYLYLQARVRERRQRPADDLVSRLVGSAGGEVLDELDVMQFVVLLLVAGNETTTNLIGNAVQALLAHPQVLARAADDPARVPAVVEETLRFDPPVQLVFRRTTQALTLRGRRLPAGAVVALLLGSANRDERVFPDPDRFDETRDTRGHLAFGFGPHFCLGASLARLEARVALEALLPRLPGCKPVGGPAPRIDSFLVRGVARLDLEAGAS